MKYFCKKTLRDIAKAKGQFIAILLVIAVGVSMFVGLMVLDKSLNSAIDGFYKSQNLSDFIINFSSVDEAGVESIRSIDEVQRAEGRILLNASLKDGESNYFVHSIPDGNAISKPKIVEGRLPNAGEIIVDYGHKRATNLAIGRNLTVVIEGQEYQFGISGFFISPEYIYLTDSIQNFIPDHKKFGAIFVHQSFVSEHFGAVIFNQVLIETSIPLSVLEFEQRLLSLGTLGGYGFLTAQEDILSVTILKADTAQLGNMGLVFAIIFFTVAAVIILISMSRNITLERNQIGIMKAIGQSNSNILLHYMSKSTVTILCGCIVGAIFGVALIPPMLLSVYSSLYTLPNIVTSGYLSAILTSSLLASAFGLVATILSCRKVLKEKPSDAMRPLPPKKIKPILLEKNQRLWSKLSYSNKLMLRNIFGNKLRAALSSVGIVACVGLIIASFSLLNMFTDIIDTKFAETNTHDVVVQFAVQISLPQDAFENEFTEITRQASIPSSFTIGDTITKTTLNAINQEGGGITLFNPRGEKLAMPNNGILLPKLLSDNLGIGQGDSIMLRLMPPMGASFDVEVRISAIYMAYLEQNIYCSLEYMSTLGVDLDITSILISIKEGAEIDKATLVEGLSQNPLVHSVLKIEDLIKATRDSMSIINSFMAFMIAMSAVLALTVIYNITAINISERRRDIATLKVLGYRAREVDRLIFVENLLITAFGAIIGIGAGAAMLVALLDATMPANMMIPYSLSISAIVFGVALGFVFTTLANLLLKRNTKKIDMVESLKSVE